MSKKILIVDDDPVLRDLHSIYFEDGGFEILTAADGVEALARVRESVDQISLIFSDVSMPNMDGYAFCRNIKNDPATAKLPVIFVSGSASLEEKIKAYAAGADDYIIKPVIERELLEKCKALIEYQNRLNALNLPVQTPHKITTQVMTFSGETDQAIAFSRNILAAKSYQELAECLFEAVQYYGLESVLQIHTPTSELNLSQEGLVSPLEADIMKLTRTRDRVFDSGSLTIINSDDFSLLIKNMPVDDPEIYGSLKEILGMITNGIDAKVRQLNNDARAGKQQEIR